jgi:hypothetical protein
VNELRNINPFLNQTKTKESIHDPEKEGIIGQMGTRNDDGKGWAEGIETYSQRGCCRRTGGESGQIKVQKNP